MNYKTNDRTGLTTGVGGVCLPAQPTTHPPPRVKQKDWELNAEALTLLLALLDGDPLCAAEKYVRIQARLTKFFECRGVCDPAQLTDLTFDRVGRRLSQREQVQTEQPIRYFYGVARNVLREYYGRQEPHGLSLEELVQADHPREDPHERQARLAQRLEHEQWLERLSRQVQQLPAASRKLLLAYGWGESRARMARRKALAAQLGITPNALKIRAYRIRATLEKRLLEEALPR